MELSEKPYYLTYIDVAVEVSKALPDYSSKYSKKSFTQKQLMTLYILKQKSKLSYDEFVDDFKVRDSAILDLGLKKVPSASAIKMFIARININIMHEIIKESIRLYSAKKIDVAIDATGMQLEDGSYSYLKRLGIATKKRKSLKVIGCVDTDKHLFTAVRMTKSYRHESKDFKPLIKETLKVKKIGKETTDKAFDSEELHEYAEKKGFKHICPVRDWKKRTSKIRGRLRKEIAKNFPENDYHRRSIIENMWFCLKRLCGYAIKARKWIMQKKEVTGRIIAYNINWIVKSLRI